MHFQPGHFISRLARKTELAARIDDIYGLLTKREVRMAGYWPGQVLFLRVYGPRLRLGP